MTDRWIRAVALVLGRVMAAVGAVVVPGVDVPGTVVADPTGAPVRDRIGSRGEAGKGEEGYDTEFAFHFCSYLFYRFCKFGR